jgi:LuxR family transcriptional regulator, maltose regulon positive regulatory protein
LRLLHAMAQARCGEEGLSTAAGIALLRDVSSEGAVRLFVDEGAAAATLLLRAQESTEGQSDPLFADYLQRVRKAFGPLATTTEHGGPERESDPLREPLTAKEIRLLQLLAEGYSNKGLAEKVFVSDSTVRTHLRNINAKLGANNRTQAVAMGRRHGLIR